MKKNLATTEDEMYPASGLSDISSTSKKKEVIFPKLHLRGKQVTALDLPADLTKTYTATVTFTLENINMSKSSNNSLDLEIQHIDNIEPADEEEAEPDEDNEGGESDNDEDNQEPVGVAAKGIAGLFKAKKGIGAKEAGLI